MEPREQTDLEKFIHAQLQKLPEREAPETLVSNVLAAITARKKLPWWKQSFAHWPRKVQGIFFVALAAVFGAAFCGVNHAVQTVTFPNLTERLSAYAWVWRVAGMVGESLLLAISRLRLEWWLASALVLVLLYSACLAAGFALFKVAGSAAGSRGT